MESRLKEVKGRVLPILQRHGVRQAAIFGSFVRAEAKKDSDMDIIVEFRGEKSLIGFISLKLELENELAREVDLLTYNALHPALKKVVLAEQVPIL